MSPQTAVFHPFEAKQTVSVSFLEAKWILSLTQNHCVCMCVADFNQYFQKWKKGFCIIVELLCTSLPLFNIFQLIGLDLQHHNFSVLPQSL